MSVTFTVNTAQFSGDIRRFAKRNDASMQRAILQATLTLKKLAKMKVISYTRHSKVKSSFLVNNINYKITDKGLTGEVLSAAEYSQAFEEGTRPHVIRVLNKKVLAGPWRGAPAGWFISKKSRAMGYAVYGKEVHHPGTPPHPFMFPAWRYSVTMLENLIKQAFTK